MSWNMVNTMERIRGLLSAGGFPDLEVEQPQYRMATGPYILCISGMSGIVLGCITSNLTLNGNI